MIELLGEARVTGDSSSKQLNSCLAVFIAFFSDVTSASLAEKKLAWWFILTEAVNGVKVRENIQYFHLHSAYELLLMLNPDGIRSPIRRLGSRRSVQNPRAPRSTLASHLMRWPFKGSIFRQTTAIELPRLIVMLLMWMIKPCYRSLE